MTALDKRKTRLNVVTCAQVRERGKYRAVVLEFSTHTVDVRLQGTRTRFPLSFETIYRTAQRIAAERARAAKKAGKRNATSL